MEASISSLLRTACRPVGEPVTPVCCRPVIYCHLVATDVSNNEVFWGVTVMSGRLRPDLTEDLSFPSHFPLNRSRSPSSGVMSAERRFMHFR